MRVPKLRKHASGQWLVHWGGKDRYLGKNRADAERAYLRELDAWRHWQEERRGASQIRYAVAPTVAELADQFLNHKRAELGAGVQYYENHLARFLEDWGHIEADQIRPAAINALRTVMLNYGYKPRTVNHDISCVKTMLFWAMGNEIIPPIDFRAVKAVPVGPVEIRHYKPAEVKAAFKRCSDKLKPWFALNYLCLLRPSEVIRLIRNEGEFMEPGVWRFDRGKMDKKVSLHRYAMVSQEAMKWLGVAEPHWPILNTYSGRIHRESGIRPKQLQKSAAMCLVKEHDATPADVELLLGHVHSRLSVTYYMPHWARLRAVASKLSLS